MCPFLHESMHCYCASFKKLILQYILSVLSLTFGKILETNASQSSTSKFINLYLFTLLKFINNTTIISMCACHFTRSITLSSKQIVTNVSFRKIFPICSSSTEFLAQDACD